MNISRWLWTLCCMGLSMSSVGCMNGQMKRFNVDLSLAPNMQQKNSTYKVEVDLVGVNSTDLEKWTDKSMKEYWRSDEPMRKDESIKTMELDAQNPSQTFPATDSLWDAWKNRGAMYLVILSNYPRGATDAPGDADARRKILPLDYARWPHETKTLKVEVTAAGLEVDTPPKPPK